MAVALDKNFLKVTSALRAQGKAAAEALINHTQAPHEDLGGESSGPDPRDTKAVRAFFNRSGLEKTYQDSIEKPSDVLLNQMHAAKLQADFLAGCERDYRMQKSVSRVRAHTMAASRRLAIGDDAGPVARGIVDQPQRLLELSA